MINRVKKIIKGALIFRFLWALALAINARQMKQFTRRISIVNISWEKFVFEIK